MDNLLTGIYQFVPVNTGYPGKGYPVKAISTKDGKATGTFALEQMSSVDKLRAILETTHDRVMNGIRIA